MGYDLYIPRSRDWSLNKGFEIAPEEWLQVVEEDSSLEVDISQGPYFALWSGDDECGKSAHSDAWLDWYGGNISAKNPDSPMIKKMVQIAHKLGAQVQGDDGEIYHGTEEGYPILD